MSDPAFDVYSTKNGLKQICNPVRQKILAELQEKDLSLTEIANITGKAQSTLSVHLDKMVKEELVNSRDDPSDNRRKIFYLCSRPVAQSKPPSEKMNEFLHETILDSQGSPISFLKGLMRAVLMGLEAIGLSIDPAMHDIGYEIGKALSKVVTSTSIEDIISELQEFYELHELGEVCVYTFIPLTIIIRDDYDTNQETGNKLCLLHQGIFKAVLEKKTGRKFRISESECFGISNNYSKFVLEPVHD
ncbi:MAG: uncharacterized protein PWQ88_455 [Candidatus Methanomethylophilaceae archaeon]|nr:uncharacterized protein [Candidatus Methanomethylophilaceae archaeon]MDI3541475.1 uncharacterized protein [Candidatus Methanomethylophilaceae archaeon]